MTDAVAPRIQEIIRHIMARRKSALTRIYLNLRTRDGKERAKQHAVPLPHGSKSCGSRTAQNAHQHRLGEIVRMMCRRNTVTATFFARAI